MDLFYQSLEHLIAPAVLTAAIMIMMMQIAFWRNTTASWAISCVALIAAIILLIRAASTGAPAFNMSLLVIDGIALYFSILILFATLITTLLAKDYLQDRAGENEEFYLLLLLSALGGLVLVSATHLASFLLGLELLGVALYALIAYPERGHLPLEAATKYLILSGAASAILLFGFALIYAALGTLTFTEIGNQLNVATQGPNRIILLAGAAFVFTGIGFKLSLVPFHMWTPDVYQGAPSPVTGYLATVSKGAIFVALLRFYHDAALFNQPALITTITIIAIASMLVGNLLALRQINLKRLLAYSSIAHMGYLLITLVILSRASMHGEAIEAANYYLVAYIVTSLAAFSLLSIICNTQRESETGDLASVTGLFWRQPLLASLLTVAMLSLAGIPLTAGFIAKFYIFSVGISANLWALVIALVVGSGIGIYYYLRVVFAMAQKPIVGREYPIVTSPIAKVVIVLLVGLTLYLGVIPQEMMNYLSTINL